MMRTLLPLLWLVALPVHAAETYEFYDGVRPLGMGGASLATVNDETALLINAAALGKLRDTFATVVDPEIEGNVHLLRASKGEVLKMSDPQVALDKLNGLKDHHYHERAQVFPSIVTRSFGLGAYGRQSVDAEVVSNGKFLFDYRSDVAAVTGFNVRTLGGVMKLGASGRLINRREVSRDDLDPTSAALKLDKLASEGVGLGGDVSAMISVPVDYLPTFALVWRDVGHTSFNLAKGLMHPSDGRPRTVRDTLDAGFAIYPILARNVRTTWALQYDDLAGDAKDPLRHVHGGFEYNYSDSVFLRLGVNQRYWTAGLELAYVGYQFQLASYGEEIGTNSRPREDRRGVAKFSFRF